MHFVTGEIVELYGENELPMARVSVRGALLHVPVSFTPGAKTGDRLLIESGVAIAILSDPLADPPADPPSKEPNNVSGDTGQADRH